MAVPRGGAAFSVDEAVAAAESIGDGPWVVKAQIHAGGRGAGRFEGDPEGKGGVRLAGSLDEVRAHAGAMLGGVLVTKQTGRTGRTVRRLYVEEGCDIAHEHYVAMLVDRGTGRVMAMASTEGGWTSSRSRRRARTGSSPSRSTPRPGSDPSTRAVSRSGSASPARRRGRGRACSRASTGRSSSSMRASSRSTPSS